MKFEQLKREAVSVEVALDRVNRHAGNDGKYYWYAAKNKKGIYLEIGGNSKEFKAYIPEFENNKYNTYPNGYFKSLYGITSKNTVEFSTWQDTHNMSKEELIKFLENTDFSKKTPKIEEQEVIEYSTVNKLIKL